MQLFAAAHEQRLVGGIAPDATYQFKHTLIRDAAYEALLKSRSIDAKCGVSNSNFILQSLLDGGAVKRLRYAQLGCFVLSLQIKRILAGVGLVLFSVTQTWGLTVKSNEPPADTLIVLQRGACEHRCAVYAVIIFADGSAIIDRQHYVRRRTLTKTTIGLDSLDELLKEAGAIHFFSMRDRYVSDPPNGCEVAQSDAPTTILSVSSGGQSKTVIHNRGCIGHDSEELTHFEDRIDKAVDAPGWTK
jgi:hypothetical protein